MLTATSVNQDCWLRGLSRGVSRISYRLDKVMLHRRVSGIPEPRQPGTERSVLFGERTAAYVPIASSRHQRQL